MTREDFLKLLYKHDDNDVADIRTIKELVNTFFDAVESRSCENCKEDYAECGIFNRLHFAPERFHCSYWRQK